MKLHAFVAMPFGSKPGHDGRAIDFDRVFTELLRPALESAGLDVFRADEEQRAGDIRADMFQELLIADLVVADLTLDNPNVWYELGVRHALRARGVILVQGPRPDQPFDLFTDRMRRYGLKDGAPDPATLEADQAAIATLARQTLEAPTRRRVSPVFALLPHLPEPDWRTLTLSSDNEYSELYRGWNARIEVARQKGRPGEILVLAGETPTRALRVEALREAGGALVKLRQFELALEQFDTALSIDPEDRRSREQKVLCLGRLGRSPEAREIVRALEAECPDDPESWTLAGRFEKEEWIARWREGAGASPAPDAARAAAAAEERSMDDAIGAYLTGFRKNPAHRHSGIQALTLLTLKAHLGGSVDPTELRCLHGGVGWICHADRLNGIDDYWARAGTAELGLLDQPAETVRRDFRALVASDGATRFALDSTNQTLILFRDLGFRPAETAIAQGIIEGELARNTPPFVPDRVLLFSGHMIDAPGRTPPRFPPALEPEANRRIAQVLEDLKAGGGDLAICQAANGGDLLFLENCQRLGVRCQVMLPFEESEFIRRSVCRSDAQQSWRERFFAMKARLKEPMRLMPRDLGPPPKGWDPLESTCRHASLSIL